MRYALIYDPIADDYCGVDYITKRRTYWSNDLYEALIDSDKSLFTVVGGIQFPDYCKIHFSFDSVEELKEKYPEEFI